VSFFRPNCTDLDLKLSGGREIFEKLLLKADVIVDCSRPGPLEKSGYGATAKCGKGFVYVQESCLGYEGSGRIALAGSRLLIVYSFFFLFCVSLLVDG
jgi:hypothetical protein